MTIAVDIMGGDFYPQNPVEGALQAVKDKGISVVLVGDEALIKKELEGKNYNASKVNIHHTTQVVEMKEPIVSALKTKKDSSMRVCYNLHKAGEVDGVVSAGNSGAMLAIGRFVLKTLPGIDRPCISALMPTLKENILLVDAGANMDCTPNQIFQFAILGSLYMQYIHGRENPRVGLLNIGGEEGKGDELSRGAFEILKNSPLNFQGNIEGKQYFDGHIDVVTCDGFAGNVLLKSTQGTAKYIKALLKEEIGKSLISMAGALLMSKAFKGLKKRTDYAEFGGAPLLGLKGNGIVCHGSSNPHAIFYGINFAQWAGDAKLVERMEEKIVEFQELLKPAS
ncbi:MAG: phosphate acyltransferase PlsX [SAR324 cluster bacterium]|nr:phosphate acyltransferase PlsX [SAR324 cluster bacterium]